MIGTYTQIAHIMYNAASIGIYYTHTYILYINKKGFEEEV